MSSDLALDAIVGLANSSNVKVALSVRPLSVRAVEDSPEQFAARCAHDADARTFALGVAEGERRALASACGALTRAAEELDSATRTAHDEVATDAVHLGIEIARALTRTEVEAGRHDLERIVRETLHASGVGRGTCVVHLNPVDVARLSDVVFRSGTTLEADPEVRQGDVHVTTQRGVLVRDIDQVLASIAQKILSDVT